MVKKIILALILILALVLRLFNLNSLPPSLNWDEISLGYNAYSILNSGQDEWGSTLPLSFRAYGDYKLPAYVYLDVPYVAILGLNEWGVRLPSALAGVGVVFFIFLIIKKLTSSLKLALWGAFISAILPWSIILSRIGLEANLALFFTVAAFYFFLKNNKYLIISSLFFSLTIFTYNSSRIVTPLLVLLLILFYFKQLKNRWAAISLAIFLIFFAVSLPNAFLQDSSARYKWTAIVDQGVINKIEQQRNFSSLQPILADLRYNRITYFIPEAFKNYFSHFNPDFLFLNGGSHYQYSVPGSGLIYPVLAPFLLIGLWQIFQKREKWQVIILGWLLISLVPAAITRDAPHALRSLMIIPPLIIFASLGIYQIKKLKNIFGVSLVFVLFVSLYLFWQNYSGGYIKNYSWSWQYGYKQAADFIKQNYDKYDRIFISKKYGEPHEFLLFYLQYDPSKLRNDPHLVRYFKSDWYWVDQFDKFIFVNDWEVKEKVKDAGLLITSLGNYPENSKFLKTINFLDGKVVFDILEIK